MVPPPFTPVVRRDLEGITEIHHRAASAFVLRPREAGPIDVVLPIRPASAASATASTATTADQMLVHSLMIVFYRMLLELGCLHLHAAAVRWNGETSLFLGGKGAGKSTLCLALARAGATVLGEDHVLVRRARARLRGQRLRRQHATHRADRGGAAAAAAGRPQGLVRRCPQARVRSAPDRARRPSLRRLRAASHLLSGGGCASGDRADAARDGDGEDPRRHPRPSRHRRSGRRATVARLRGRLRRLARGLPARAQPPPLGPRRRRRLRGGRLGRSRRSRAAGSSES